MDYDYLIGPAANKGYNAYIPDFPPAAVVAVGKTREETAMRMAQAMKAAVEFLHSKGIPVPSPRSYRGEIPPGFELVSA